MSPATTARAEASGATAGRVRALVALTLGRTFRRLPVLLGAVLMALPIGFAALYQGGAADVGALSEFLLSRYSTLVVGMLLPLTALVTAAGPMSAEREDGTVLYLLTTTTSRGLMVIVRWLLATAITSAVVLVAVVGTGLLAGGGADPTGLVAAFALGSVAGAALYSALFLAMAVSVPRALLMGLLYVLIWEGVVSRLFAAVRYLSVRQILLGITQGVAPEAERGVEAFAAALPVGTASLWAGIVLVGSLALAIRALRRLSVAAPG